MHFRIKKGLDIPLSGQPDHRIEDAMGVASVAVLGQDYLGLKPTMLIKEGDKVAAGAPLFEDKKNPGMIVTAPQSGTVRAINRGARRALVSVVIDVSDAAPKRFAKTKNLTISGDSLGKIRDVLTASGQWAALRTRPYGKVPKPGSTPASIFVNAADTNPLAADPAFVIDERKADFVTGVKVLAAFGVPVYVCHRQGAALPTLVNDNVHLASFSGPHPSGLTSTHVHCIDPVHADKTVWSIGYQDVIAFGHLFSQGTIDVTRLVAVAGPLVSSPRMFKTRTGACVSQLIERRTKDGKKRVISGSVLNGHHAKHNLDYLGRYHDQVSVIEENDDREFMGWIAPGVGKFSATNSFLSSLIKPRSFAITSSQNGSPRAMVPIGVYERVMPLDILPTPLLKALLVKDTDAAQELGCLELVEEDLALCSFVDPGKHDFAPVLRSTLNQIEIEG